jgi:uncharacterized protein
VSGLQLFRPGSAFRPREAGYRLLPFRFMRWSNDEVLLVNDVGEFLFLGRESFEALLGSRLPSSNPDHADLEAKHFLASGESDLPIELLATQYRTKKGFLDGFTKLHLFVVTLRCDHTCRYCQVSRVSANRTRYDMSRETAERAIDLVFRSPAEAMKIEFQGGESLLNFELIRFIVEEVGRRNAGHGKEIEFVIATNLTPLTDEILGFLHEHSILVSTSLDGPAFVHNANRPRPDRDSYEITIRNLEQARGILGHDRVSAVMTTTQLSLSHPREIVDEYVRQGFDAIFLRPISPYGFAVRTGEALKYQTDQFLAFFKDSLDHIIEINRSGVDFLEVYSQILLTKMLTPFSTGYVDLQSPTGAGIGAVVYNYDGDVYASDEARMLAEMGDRSLRLGNVHADSFEEIFGGETLQALVNGSILETLPGCAECAFVPYCGADPVFNYRTQGDIIGHRPTSAFCAKNMGILRHLFELLRGDDPFVRELLVSWATRVPLPGPAPEVTA